ncbi:MAG: flagellar export protein FliJ [Planctomycetota bacterium]
MTSAFQFPFESLLNLKQASLETAAAALANAHQAIDLLESRRAEIVRQRDLDAESLRQRMTGTIRVDRLLDDGRHRIQIDQQIIELDQQYGQIQIEIEKRRVALSAAEMEVRKLEKLRDRQRSQWEQEQQRRQQNGLDEIASQRFVAMQNNGQQRAGDAR